MPYRLVALDEGPDIPVDRKMVVIGRHPHCDARLDSIRVSRRHCCMVQDNTEVIVRDLGSTNGIRINGQRVEEGRLRPGDELSIAHIRFRLDDGQGQEMTLAEPSMVMAGSALGNDDYDIPRHVGGGPSSKRGLTPNGPGSHRPPAEPNPLAAAVRDLLPPGIGDRCRIQVIVQMQPEDDSGDSPGAPPVSGPAHANGDSHRGRPDKPPHELDQPPEIG
jgi:hypothetical protein